MSAPADSSTDASRKFGLTEWLVVGTSALGFALDIFEILMLPLIIGPAVVELKGLKEGTPQFLAARETWVGLLLFIPAIAGGVFGLLGGYMTDRYGRRRVLVWTVVIYQLSACLAAFSTSMEMLLILRCTTFIGVCIEFVAAVAWLAELFPTPHQREKVLGYTQAFSSAGGFLAAGAYGLILYYHGDLPGFHMPEFLQLGQITDEHAPWRYMLMSGLIPAVPLILIRPFLPESPIWQRKKAAGTLKRPSFFELFQPALRKTTIVTALMFACSYGAAFGAIQHLPRIVPGLPGVRELAKDQQQQVVKTVQLWQEGGGLVGRFLLAYLAVVIFSRRKLLRIFQIPGLFLLPAVFLYAALYDLMLLEIGIFLVGLLTVAQFSFWGNYLPRVYPVHLRGTGESFAANVGGRMIGTSAALVTTQLANFIPGTTPAVKLSYAAATVGLSVYLLGLILSFWLPEPKEESMPD